MNIIHQQLSILELIALGVLALCLVTAVFAVTTNFKGMIRYLRIRRM